MYSKKLNIIIVFIFFISECINAQDIALNKPYILSAPPNYSLAAPFSDKSSLTDGIYTVGYFWTSPTTLGWKNYNKITINIDLGNPQLIGEITFNTARRIEAGVNFPENLFVFLSNDNQSFTYAGDIANKSDNNPGGYQIKKFMLKNINQLARYVLLIAIPKGVFLFCDEIEVIKGNSKSKIALSKLISKDSLNNAVDSIKAIDFNRDYYLRLLNRQNNRLFDQNGKDQTEITKRLNDNNISQNTLYEIKSQINQLHALTLRKDYKTSFEVEKYNPWDTLSDLHEPKENADTLNFKFLIPENGVEYGAFVLTNNQLSNQNIAINTSGSYSKYSIVIFKAVYVPSEDFTKIPDALIPLGKNTILEPGVSDLFIFKIIGEKSGIINSTLTIRSSNKTAYANISGQVINPFSGNNIKKLNAINWAYLNYPMLQDRKGEAVKDLDHHHINTVVVPPVFIPRMSNNYETFLNYLDYFKNIDNILLFTNYSDKENCKQFGKWMSPEFKNEFILWYNKLMVVLNKSGFSNSQIYLYPYDEVHGNDVDDFKKFATWARQAIPEIKIYATLTNTDAINNILPFVDIAQIESKSNLLSVLPPHSCEIWTYSTKSSARSLSPYLYYRLMAWNAFANEVTGIGFWNYADEGMGRKLNLFSDSWINPSNSYSVVYNGQGKEIVSSRRWEAFQLGIEDYSILSLYAKKYGLEKAKLMANKVLADPQNFNKADEIRNQMLSSF